MQNLVLSAAAGAFLVTGSAAFAATDTGTIKKIDPKGDAITLDDGKVFVLAEGTEAELLDTVIFKLKAGKMLATKVQIAK